MLLEEIILILENKIRTLQTAKGFAAHTGDMESYAKFDSELLSTQNTLERLQTLP
jgi:hypothetical protein